MPEVDATPTSRSLPRWYLRKVFALDLFSQPLRADADVYYNLDRQDIDRNREHKRKIITAANPVSILNGRRPAGGQEVQLSGRLGRTHPLFKVMLASRCSPSEN